MTRVFGFCGISNSGKTTLIEKLLRMLVCENKVLCIKHDPKNKAIFDTEGKDSARFFSLKSDVFIASDHKNAFFSHQAENLYSFLKSLRTSYDYIFIEGYKVINCPRICIARSDAGGVVQDELKLAKALALDEVLRKDFSNESGFPIFDLNDSVGILAWIQENAITLEDFLQGWIDGYN